MLTEFRLNGNWRYDVQVNSGLSLHKLQPHFNTCNLQSNSK